MKKINMLIFILAASLLWGEGLAKEEMPVSLAGSIFSINADFDIYRVRMIGKKTPTYYIMMPAPEYGIGGRGLTYLGRMPAETKLQIVKVGKSKYLRRPEYWVKPTTPVNNRIKGSSSRKVYNSDENLDDQIYLLSSIASNVGLYEKGYYSNGLPKLNETWFTLIELKE